MSQKKAKATKKPKLPQAQLFEVPQVAPAGANGGPEPPTQHRRDSKQDFVNQVMYWLTAPYVTWPGYEDIYQSNDNKNKALIQRLAHHKEIVETERCTEFEAMLYISTATLVHPPSHDWSQIYFWLFSHWNRELAKEIDVQPARPELNSSQKEDLARLRHWIYRTQVDHLKAKQKGESAARAEEAAADLEAQRPRLFE